jgi:hypothetical protein
MEKFLGQDFPEAERKQFLQDNCDATEEISYTRHFTADELTEKKEVLANVDIEITDVEAEKKEAIADFKARLKPLGERRAELVKKLKAKSETVTGNTFKFIDGKTRMVGFYNHLGELVHSRQAMRQEMQKTMFMELRTGTED